MVELTLDVPDGSNVRFAYAGGVQVDWQAVQSGNPAHVFLNVCSGIRRPGEGCITQQRVDALRGDEMMQVDTQSCTGNPDDGTLRCSQSKKSNGLVPRQL